MLIWTSITGCSPGKVFLQTLQSFMLLAFALPGGVVLFFVFLKWVKSTYVLSTEKNVTVLNNKALI